MHCNYLPQDWATRMHGGVAFYDNHPVTVAVDGATIYINSFPEGKIIKSIKFDDPLLDLASPKLGYVNLPKKAFYMYRRPERKYKQTLTWGSCSLFDPAKSPNNTRNDEIDRVFLSTHMKDMLLDKYPSLTLVLASLKAGKATSKAISKNVCLSADSFGIIRVFYKMDEVGFIKPDEKVVNVPKGKMAWVVSKYLENFDWVIS